MADQFGQHFGRPTRPILDIGPWPSLRSSNLANNRPELLGQLCSFWPCSTNIASWLILRNHVVTQQILSNRHNINKLHTSFWVKSSRTIVYIQNRFPHSILDNITPEQVFIGNKPYLSHLRIFGCPIYIHIPKEKRTKLEQSGKKDIFIGYRE